MIAFSVFLLFVCIFSHINRSEHLGSFIMICTNPVSSKGPHESEIANQEIVGDIIVITSTMLLLRTLQQQTEITLDIPRNNRTILNIFYKKVCLLRDMGLHSQ